MTEITMTDAGVLPALLAMYPEVFPDEDLCPLLRRMIGQPTVLSLIAGPADKPLGHVAFSFGQVAEHSVALLGPLAVAPDQQGRGIGSALVQVGIEAVLAQGAVQVLVLGDPGYYGRFGFEQETDVAPPYPLPADWATAWQSLSLDEEVPAGTLQLADYWMDPVLWAE